MKRQVRTSAGPFGVAIQASAFVRKEIVEILRQPRLLITLVFGPFLLLVLFGNSYRQDSVRLRTIFVGPEGGAYQEALAQYGDSLEQYVRVVAYTNDRAAAEAELLRGRVDLVVIFPGDAIDQISQGHQATVVVLNDKLDPVQNAAVQIAARLAVQEVNASIVSSVVEQAQSAYQPVDVLFQDSLTASAALTNAAASQDAPAIREASSGMTSQINRLRQGAVLAVDAYAAIDDPALARREAQLEDLRRELDRLDTLASATGANTNPESARQNAADISRSLESMRPTIADLGTIDPAVLVRPFTSLTQSALPKPVGVTAFFAPSSIALLLQHLALSFAALAIVRDRSLGLLEVYRVGPTSVVAIMAGRFIAFTLAGSAVGGALILAVTRLLDVPIVGSLAWTWIAITLLLCSAVAMGIVVALVSGTDSEVVQYAMLVLLASLFFGGFVLDLGLFNYPGKAISWVLPVTHAIRMLQYAMLRGATPKAEDVIALAGQAVVYGALATLLFRRRLRVS